MNEQQQRIHDLVIKALKDRLTPEEGAELDKWQAESPDNKETLALLMDPHYLVKAIELSRKLDVDAAWEKTCRELKFNKP